MWVCEIDGQRVRTHLGHNRGQVLLASPIMCGMCWRPGSSRAKWRREVVPSSPHAASLGKLDKAQDSNGVRVPRPWTYAWADLLWRLYLVNPWNCPHCGRRMLLKALVLPPAAIRAVDGIYRAAGKSARAPPGLAAAK
jgi:hypothetical protein